MAHGLTVDVMLGVGQSHGMKHAQTGINVVVHRWIFFHFCLGFLLFSCGIAAALDSSKSSAVPAKAMPIEPGSLAEKKVVDLRFQPDPALPNVLLLGDSISIGYTLPVRSLLKGKANVFRPIHARGLAENCSDTGFGLKMLDRWLALQPKWDVIHFNWGLHDLKHMKPNASKPTTSTDPNDPPLRSVEEYQANLEKIVARLEQTGARLIFATTTPVPAGANRPFRNPADPARYNAAAIEVMQRHGIRVDDLFGLVQPQATAIQLPNNVHFTDQGSKLLAKQVVATINAELPPKTQAQRNQAP